MENNSQKDSNAARSAIMRAIRLYGGCSVGWARDNNFGAAVDALLAEGSIVLSVKRNAYVAAAAKAVR